MAQPQPGTSTRSLHADDVLNLVSDVAPPMHVATTFRYSSDPATLVPAADADAVPVCLDLPHPSISIQISTSTTLFLLNNTILFLP